MIQPEEQITTRCVSHEPRHPLTPAPHPMGEGEFSDVLLERLSGFWGSKGVIAFGGILSLSLPSCASSSPILWLVSSARSKSV